MKIFSLSNKDRVDTKFLSFLFMYKYIVEAVRKFNGLRSGIWKPPTPSPTLLLSKLCGTCSTHRTPRNKTPQDTINKNKYKILTNKKYDK